MIIIQFILLFLQSMKNKKKQIIPAFATHPGELIKDELVERIMTQKELAELTGIKPSILSETINGKRSISLNVAVALEKAFGIPTQYWMNMQTQYKGPIVYPLETFRERHMRNFVTAKKRKGIYFSNLILKTSALNMSGDNYVHRGLI